MNCKKCGIPLVEGAKMCSNCGTLVEQTEIPATVEQNQVAGASLVDQEPVFNQANMESPINPVVSPLTGNQNQPIQTPQVVNQQSVQPQVVNQGDMLTQMSTGQSVNNNSPKKDNKLFIIICVVLIIIIGVLLVLILNNNTKKSENSNNNDKASEKTTANEEKKTTESTNSTGTTLPRATVDTTKGSYTDYYGFRIYVPETFTVQSQSGTLTYTSTTKRQMLAMQLQDFAYVDIALEFDSYIKALTDSGFSMTTKDQNQYKGIKYSVVRGTMEGSSISTGYAEFASGYSTMFAFRTDYATENEYLETLLQIITNSTSTSTFSKGDSIDKDANIFVKDSSKLTLE